MIAIPAKYTTGYNTGLPLCYIVRLTLGTSDTLYAVSAPNLVLTYGGASVAPSTIYLAIEIDKQAVDYLSEMDYNMIIQDGGSMGGVNTVTLKFLNHAEFYNFVAQFDVDNRQIEIWEGYVPANKTIAIDTDMILKYRGVMRDMGNYTFPQYTLPCEDSRRADTQLLPNRLISKTMFPNVSLDVVGKFLPILVGDFYTENNGALNQLVGIWNSPPSILVNPARQDCLIADHQISPMNSFNPVWLVDDPKNYVAIIMPQYIVAVIDGQYFLDNHYFLRVKPNAAGDVFVIPRIAGAIQYTHNPTFDHSLAVDGDLATFCLVPASTYMSLKMDSIATPGVAVQRADVNNQYDPFGTIDGYINIKVGNIVGTPTVTLYHSPSNTVSSLNGALSSVNLVANSWNTLFFQLDNQLTWDELQNYEILIHTGGGESAEIYFVNIKVRSYLNMNKTAWTITRAAVSNEAGQFFQKAQKRLDVVQGTVRSSLFPSCKGCQYGSWIGARSSTPLIDANGLPVASAPYFVEWILREKLKVTSDKIDTASFDSVNNTSRGHASWNCDGSILVQKDAMDILKQICFEFGMMLVLTQAGKYRLVALDQGASVFTITDTELLLDNGIPAIEMDKTPLDKVVNDITLSYRINYQSNQPERTIYVSDYMGAGVNSTNLAFPTGALRDNDYATWMEESVTRYKTRKRQTYNMEFIRTDTTAAAITKLLCDWLAFRRLIVKLKVRKTLDTLALEIGDIIKINNKLLTTIHSGVTTFMITRINYPPVGRTADIWFTLEAEEIPNVNTGLPIIKSLSDSQGGQA